MFIIYLIILLWIKMIHPIGYSSRLLLPLHRIVKSSKVGQSKQFKICWFVYFKNYVGNLLIGLENWLKLLYLIICVIASYLLVLLCPQRLQTILVWIIYVRKLNIKVWNKTSICDFCLISYINITQLRHDTLKWKRKKTFICLH